MTGQGQAGEISKSNNKLLPSPNCVLGPKLMFAKCDKHYPSSSGQTSLARAVTNFTKHATKINFGPSTGWSIW